jgi:hypothetical protein
MDTVEALRRLGQLLEERRQPYDLVIIGGTALILQRFVERATRDVDAIAVVTDGMLVAAKPLPAPLAQAVRDIATLHGLDDSWLNDGPESLMDLGLPAGFLERARTERFGALTLRLPSRFDQIHFKLYAATDLGPNSKHDQDLAALAPTPAELEQAAEWCRTHDASPAFAELLMAALERHRGG